MIYRYLLIILACSSVLLGIQLPNFVTQYEQRLSAHLNEVDANLSGFQKIADRRHNGSLQQLLEHHRQSSDATFQDEALAIDAMVQRRAFLMGEQQAMTTSLPGKVTHLLGQPRSPLIRDTLDQYSVSVPLNKTALSSGLILVMLVLFVVEGIKFSMSRLARRRSNKRHAIRS